MSTNPPDLMDRWTTTMDQASRLARDWWDQSQAMIEPWLDVMATSAAPQTDDRRGHSHDHGPGGDHEHGHAHGRDHGRGHESGRRECGEARGRCECHGR